MQNPEKQLYTRNPGIVETRVGGVREGRDHGQCRSRCTRIHFIEARVLREIDIEEVEVEPCLNEACNDCDWVQQVFREVPIANTKKSEPPH